MASWRRALVMAALVAAASGPGDAAGGEVKRILHFSDVHMNITRGERGGEPDVAYELDATPALLRSALAFAKQQVPDPDVFLYTGDSAAHFAKDGNWSARAMRTTAGVIEEFYPSTPRPGRLHVSSVVGNADTAPGYSMAMTDPEWEANPSLTRFADVWPSDELSAADREMLSRRGYLAYELDEKLTVLSLNTLPYSPRLSKSASETPDPFGQFRWLNETLHDLRRQDKVAFIVGHIPPIVAPHTDQPVWRPEYIEAYMQVLAENAGIVKAQIFGHIHSVEFRTGSLTRDRSEKHSLRTVDRDGEQKALVELPPVFTGAAISPLFGNNPGFISWEVDPSTYDLLDYVVYGTNVSASADDLEWKALYRASEAYGVKSLTAAELKGFGDRARAAPSLLERYYFFTRALSYRQSPCADAVCHSRWQCSIQWLARSDEHLACMAREQSMASAMAQPASESTLPWRRSYAKVVDKVVDMSDLAECVAAVWVLGLLLLLRIILRRRGKRVTADLSSDACPM